MEENKKIQEFDTAMNVISQVAKLQETQEVKNNMKSKMSSMLKVSNEKLDKIDESIKNLSLEEIKALTDEQIEEIYTVDGHVLEFDIKVDEKKALEFKKDFLLYIKQVEIYGVKIDETIADLENDLKEHNIEYRDIISKYGAMYLVTRGQMENIVLKSKNDSSIPQHQVDRAEAMLFALENALTLNYLIDYIKEYSLENILKDFRNRQIDIYKKYKVVTKRMGIKADLTKLPVLEEYLELPEEYLEYTNLCYFIAMRFIAYKSQPSKEVEGMFLSNIPLVYKAVVEGSILPEDKEKLINGVKTIIDAFREFEGKL